MVIDYELLHKAAKVALEENDVSRMQDLIAEWRDALARENKGRGRHLAPFTFALGGAIERDLHEMVRLLVQNGATIMLKNLSGIFQREQYSMLETLLSAGWDINTSYGYPGDTLLANVASSRPPMLKFLLEHGADPNLNLRAEHLKAIELAALFAGTDVIDILIEHGAQLHGRQPLQNAARWGRIDIVEHLLDCEVDIDGIPDNEDIYETERIGTALHAAVTAGQKGVVVTLLKQGANKSLKDSEGQTAWEIAREKKSTDIMRLLE